MALVNLLILSLFLGVTLAQYDCQFDTKYPMQLPSDCGHFFMCYQGNRLEYFCRQNQFYNSYTKQCAPQSDVNCLPPRAISGQMCAPNTPTTFQPDPESCSHYTTCIDGFKYQLKCAKGLFFNEAIGACDLAANVRCIGKSTAVVSTLIGVPNIELCPIKGTNEFQTHPDDCKLFYNCINQLYYEYKCPVDAHFNPSTKSCDTEDNAQCTITVAHPDCPEGSPSYPQPDEDNCADFFICYNGNKLNYTCHEDHIFNNETLLCDIYSPGGICPKADRCQDETDYTKFPHETDCDKYYKCLSGVSHEVPCPSKLHFNPATNRCETPEDAKCTLGDTTTTQDVVTTTEAITTTTEEITTTVVPGPCTGQADYTRVPHEDDCSHYYVCLDGEGLEAKCPIPLVFDSKSRQCVRAEESDCQTIVCIDFEKFPDSESCDKYFQCMSNTLLEASCPEPLHYNVHSGTCDYKNIAGCEK